MATFEPITSPDNGSLYCLLYHVHETGRGKNRTISDYYLP
jgi:hypothetical protein